jgi:hypothetical protein
MSFVLPGALCVRAASFALLTPSLFWRDLFYLAGFCLVLFGSQLFDPMLDLSVTRCAYPLCDKMRHPDSSRHPVADIGRVAHLIQDCSMRQHTSVYVSIRMCMRRGRIGAVSPSAVLSLCHRRHPNVSALSRHPWCLLPPFQV